MNIFEQTILGQIDNVCTMLENLPLEDRVEMLNQIREKLHNISPFKDEPVDLVLWVKSEKVTKNQYNPNTVARPEMKLLEKSIQHDGYTQPIVGYNEQDKYEVVDGFHRYRIGTESKKVRDRIHGYLPITRINGDCSNLKDRMAATIRHNRARGVHGVMPMADIVATLIREGWNDEDIATELGMDADEVLRFKQNLGLPELFKNESFSPSWE